MFSGGIFQDFIFRKQFIMFVCDSQSLIMFGWIRELKINWDPGL